MQGVGKTSLVMFRKSRRAMRASNSGYGNGVPVLAARARDARRTLAATPAVRNWRRDVIGDLPVMLLYYQSRGRGSGARGRVWPLRLLFPVRQTAGRVGSTSRIQLLFETPDVRLDQFAQLGDLGGELVAGDLVLLQRSFRGPAGGAPSGRGSSVHVIRDRGRHAFVVGAPDAISVQSEIDFNQLLFELDALFADLRRKRRSGIDSAA